jgi:Family of unknown function (DUF6338)
MVPSTWLALLLFLLVVSPGVLFDLLESRRKVNAAESAFREIGRVVLGSVGFTVVAIVVLLLVRLGLPTFLPDPGALIRGGSRYFADHYIVVFSAIGAEAVLAHGAAALVHWWLARTNGGDTIRHISAWSKVLKGDVPPQHHVYGRLRLSDGAVFSGRILHFTADLPLADRELVLGQPMASKTGTNPIAPVPNAYRFVIIRGAAIESMAIEHRRAVPSTAGTQPAVNKTAATVVDATATQQGAPMPTPAAVAGVVTRMPVGAARRTAFKSIVRLAPIVGCSVLVHFLIHRAWAAATGQRSQPKHSWHPSEF